MTSLKHHFFPAIIAGKLCLFLVILALLLPQDSTPRSTMEARNGLEPSVLDTNQQLKRKTPPAGDEKADDHKRLRPSGHSESSNGRLPGSMPGGPTHAHGERNGTRDRERHRPKGQTSKPSSPARAPSGRMTSPLVRAGSKSRQPSPNSSLEPEAGEIGRSPPRQEHKNDERSRSRSHRCYIEPFLVSGIMLFSTECSDTYSCFGHSHSESVYCTIAPSQPGHLCNISLPILQLPMLRFLAEANDLSAGGRLLLVCIITCFNVTRDPPLCLAVGATAITGRTVV